MSKQNFAINLRLICQQYRSVAEVCRLLEMNRQQFNKYLSGKIYPSKHNLSRICQFLKLSEEQLNSSPDKFRQLVLESFQNKPDSEPGELEKFVDMLPSSIETLGRYEGYYYSHFHSLGFPGHLIRSLVHIYRYGDRFYTQNIEHLWDKENRDAQRIRFKYRGLALYLGDRIFITEAEILTRSVICHTILFPSYRNIVDTLSGITTGVGSMHSHMPRSTRVEFQFLGKQVDVREALRGCGIFDLDSTRISSDIKERIHNEITDQEFMLTARDY